MVLLASTSGMALDSASMCTMYTEYIRYVCVYLLRMYVCARPPYPGEIAAIVVRSANPYFIPHSISLSDVRKAKAGPLCPVLTT